MNKPSGATPVITIGGFLGAGKTTLVNQLLSQSDGKRVVVFVNDFGAINIDYRLIETADADRISLTNGCVCCSLNDDLITSILDFCQAAPPDAFVIEASGVADPRSLDSSIATLQGTGHVQLACRVYVLDTDNFDSLDYEDSELIIDHAVASDLTLLNKWDLADSESVEKLESLLERSAPHTIVRRTQFCNVSLTELLGLSATADLLNDVCKVANNDATMRFKSWSCSGFSPMNDDAYRSLIDDLYGTALRAKGTLYFEEHPDKAFKFDFVGKRHTLIPADIPGVERQSEFVAIGRRDHFSSSRLSKHFRASLETH